MSKNAAHPHSDAHPVHHGDNLNSAHPAAHAVTTNKLLADSHVSHPQRGGAPAAVRASYTPETHNTGRRTPGVRPDNGHVEITPIQNLVGRDKTTASQLAAHLDPAKDANLTVEQMIQSGKFIDKQNHSVTDHQPAAKSSVVPHVKVVLADKTTDPSHAVNPDFVVTTRDVKGPDGRMHKKTVVEAHNNFEKNPKDEIVVQVDRGADGLEPSKDKQAATLALKTYIEKRVKVMHPESATNDVAVVDNQGVLPQNPATPPETRVQQRMEQFAGADPRRQYMPRSRADSYFPESSEVPRNVAPQQLDPAQVLRDVIAGMFNPDQQNPFETARDGRYGIEGFYEDQLLLGLMLELGDPPDPAKIVALEQMLHMSYGSLHALMSKLQNHQKLTAGDLKQLLPKELQQKLATDLAKVYLEAAGGDIALAALAWKLGKTPNNWLTQQDLADANNVKYMTSANTMAQLSASRQVAGQNDMIPWQGTPSGTAESLARMAETEARRRGTVGHCYNAVADSLDKIGVHYTGGAACDALAQARRDPRWVEIPLNEIRRGDMTIHEPTAGHSNGHIAIALGNGLNGAEASDHVEGHVINRGAATHAFRLRET